MSKALSIWQPYASMIMGYMKVYETRSWTTDYRGRLYIHASKKVSKEDLGKHEDCVRLLEPLTYGAVLGYVELVNIQPAWFVKRRTKNDIELYRGDFSDGRYAWVLHDPVLFKEPLPYRGQQGLFEIPDDLLLGRELCDGWAIEEKEEDPAYIVEARQKFNEYVLNYKR